ncbi:histidine N-acetyltransferase-like [Bufo gargarizans]|uniref:histidine N-acetyltransferase-like n=1 Tax=Bufo gargarizans TaxID=30331 RepID=UPI001CF4DEB7|nr:histidine N-acetyltransferase-like [Bufo gargarizans]
MSDETSIPHIDFSPATEEDYEELLSISSGLFYGLDYLPFWYHSWLKEPNRRMIVAKCEGKVAVISVFLPADQLETTIKVLESRVNNLVNNLDRIKNLSVLGPEEILSFFEESKTRQQLLPSGLLVQNWLPLTTHKSNLNLLMKEQIVWIYSHPGESHDSKSSSEVTTSCDGSHAYLQGFLSIGSRPYPVPFAEEAHCFHIDMFGNDPSCAKVHVLEQLNRVHTLPAGSSIILILYADESLRSELSQLCEGLTPFHIMREQLIIESELHG